MRRLDLVRLAAIVLAAAATAGCGVLHRTASPPPSPYCRAGDPLAGVYHPDRLHVKKGCALVSGVVTDVKFEPFDGDVHVDLRPDAADEHLLSDGNEKVGGNLIVEIIPQDRAAVAVPEVGAHVSVVGPYVDDATHDWREIHPAWWVSAGRIVPATAEELARVRHLLRFEEPAGGE
jgi:hypothetical protein